MRAPYYYLKSKPADKEEITIEISASGRSMSSPKCLLYAGEDVDEVR